MTRHPDTAPGHPVPPPDFSHLASVWPEQLARWFSFADETLAASSAQSPDLGVDVKLTAQSVLCITGQDQEATLPKAGARGREQTGSLMPENSDDSQEKETHWSDKVWLKVWSWSCRSGERILKWPHFVSY